MFGQKSMSVTLISPGPLPGDGKADSHIEFVAEFKNNGTVTIPAGDKLIIWMSINGGINRYNFMGASGTWEDYTVTQDINVGDSFTLNGFTGDFPTSAIGATLPICANLSFNAQDFDIGKVSSCYLLDVVSPSVVSTTELTLKEKTNVLLSNNILNIASTVKETLNYSIISLTGKALRNGTFNNSKQVDLTNVAKGIYVVTVTNGTGRITKKIVVQ